MNEGKTSVILFTENVRKDIKKEHFKEFEKVAQEEFDNFKSDAERTLFIVSGVSFGIQIRLAHTLGAQSSTLPAVYIFKPKTHERGLKYKMSLGSDEKITAQKVRDFINDYKEGNMPQDYKSEPIPVFETPTSQVRQIVGLNYYETINDPKKDVFVAYMSSYCRTCEDLIQVWE